MLLPNLHSFVNLSVQGNIVIKKTQQFLRTLVLVQIPRPDHTGDLRGKIGLSLHDDGVQTLRHHQKLVLRGELAQILNSQRLLSRLLRPPSTGPRSPTSGLLLTTSASSRDSRATVLLNILEVLLGVGEGGSPSGGSGLLTVPPSSVLADELGVELERNVGVSERVDRSTSGVNVGGERRTTLHRDTRVLSLQKVPSLLPPLSEVNVQRLRAEDLSVHLGESAVGLLGGRITDETETLGLTLVVLHDDGRGNGSKLLEFLAENSIRNLIIEILDVQVGALAHPLFQQGDVVGLELLLPLRPLLGPGNVDNLSLELKVVDVIDSGNSALVGLVVEESEAPGFSLSVLHQHSAGDLSVLLEEILNFFVRGGGVQVLDVHVGKVFGVLLHPFLLGNKGANIHNERRRPDVHAIHFRNGIISHLFSLIMNKAITLALSLFVNSDLARKNVSKVREGVVQGLVINGLVQVLDEHVSNTGLSHGGITLRPHDTARLVLDGNIVQGLQSTLGVKGVVEVDVGISERSAGDSITANTNRSHRSNLVEQFEQMPLGGIKGEVANVQGSGLERRVSHLLRRRKEEDNRSFCFFFVRFF